MTNRRAKARETSGSRRADQTVRGCRREQIVPRWRQVLRRVERHKLPAARRQVGRGVAVAVIATVRDIRAMRRVFRTVLIVLENGVAGVDALQSARRGFDERSDDKQPEDQREKRCHYR